MLTFPSRFLQSRQGAVAIEYALIAALIAVTILGSITLLGSSFGEAMSKISAAVVAAAGG